MLSDKKFKQIAQATGSNDAVRTHFNIPVSWPAIIVDGDWRGGRKYCLAFGTNLDFVTERNAVFRPDALLVAAETFTDGWPDGDRDSRIVAVECCSSWTNFLQKRPIYAQRYGAENLHLARTTVVTTAKRRRHIIHENSFQLRNLDVIYIVEGEAGQADWVRGYVKHCPASDHERFVLYGASEVGYPNTMAGLFAAARLQAEI